MPSPPNASSPAALVNGAYHQDAGASGVPHESLIAVVGGSAVAEGQDTVTTGLVQDVAEDKGGISVIVGDAIFEASAHGSGGVEAAANTFLTVSGADFIFIDETSVGGSQANDAWAISEISFIALNINGWSPEGGPLDYELLQPSHQVPDGHLLPILGMGLQPDGNYADVKATAEAEGAGSLSAALTNALTVENHFSSVNAIAVVAV